MPTVNGYVRVSTIRQTKMSPENQRRQMERMMRHGGVQGQTLEEQEGQIQGYIGYRLQGYTWGRWYQDEGVSGVIPFRQRPAGGELSLAVQKGDAVIITRLDRAFRSTIDALQTVEYFKGKGVSLHFLDMNLDTSSPAGELLLTIMAAFARMERCRTRERIIEGKRLARERGHNLGGNVPYGFQVYEGKLIPCKYDRSIGKRFVELSKMGYTFMQIRWWTEQHNVRCARNRTFSNSRVQRWIAGEKRLAALESSGQTPTPYLMTRRTNDRA